MATLLDIGLLNVFSTLFPVLFVLVFTAAILQKTQLLGENAAINWFVAIIFAFLVGSSGALIKVINFITPWFVIILIFVFLLVFIFRFGGVKEEQILVQFQDPGVAWTLVIIGIVILLFGIGQGFGQEFLEKTSKAQQEGKTIAPAGQLVGNETDTSTLEYQTNLTRTFFHPKVLGLLLIFIIAMFTVALLARQEAVPK